MSFLSSSLKCNAQGGGSELLLGRATLGQSSCRMAGHSGPLLYYKFDRKILPSHRHQPVSL